MSRLLTSLLAAAWVASPLWPQPRAHTPIPKTWDESALADWATPLAGLNARPTHAIKGHEFGLRLTPGEREQLIAFLRTL